MDEDIDVRALRRIAIGGMAAIAVAAGAAVALLEAWDRGRDVVPMDEPQHWASGPLLETAPRDALETYLAEKRALLAGYGWVDPAAGIARVPIEQAMRAIAAMSPSDPASDSSPSTGAPRSGVRRP
ncbi:hypothetical protein PIGHUM_00852 [Pigmentiphaga humi]|uniref:Uncharacterized protein n=1 Tax=Pigmentiphaga humi TaxID=2478468 RepID=A0A3P4AXI8_9BURK|nr:hypothetical protein [Pigmentiphaga humi]VCU68794.1 hypothetical protein PIGHUM_00852 [Pigmentiphaga humi]